ncbi:hypothetical protein CQW23_19920 [Capsicum baccatum]|uniref:Uncharacterized protein n=1 Tax=Capsicum baccatum TaxID=33114 RepID=A0A2G2W760_CAPBA|nr:hypothetical protein CQW23_19920 [Capsicum baccatum]
MAPDATHALAVREKVQKFLQAACSGDVELFKKLAKQLDDGKGLAGTVADVKDANKRGALIFAAREGKTELCKYLVEELKVDVNEKDEEGETPVLHAARHGHTATVHYLIEQGADPATPSASGATALHHAAGNGHIEVVKLLLSKGVNVDFQSDAGTPLMWAAGLGHEDVVEVLLEHGANLHAQTDDDNCPLISAVAANSLPCVELLVKAGANVNVKAGDATPLLIAAHNGSTEIINCLLQAGADPNAEDEDGNKPIQLAATSGSRAAVEALLAVTPRIQSVPEWSVDGVIEFMQSEYRREQEREEAGRKANKSREASIPKKDLPEVTPEAKKKAAEAKARGDESFKRNDIATAIDAYTQRFEEAATAFYEGVHLDPESKELVTAFREAVEAGRKFHGTDKNSLSSSKS